MATICQRELNKQLQALQGRVKSLEEQVSELHETQLTDIGQTAAAFAALIKEEIVTGLPTYIANQLILKIASAALGMASEALEHLPGIGEAGSLLSDITNQANTVKSIIQELVSTPLLGADFWSQFQMEMMIPKLTIPPYLAGVVGAAFSAAAAAIDAAQTALNADPGNADLQAALQAAITFRDNMDAAAEAVNRIVDCKTASQVLGL